VRSPCYKKIVFGFWRRKPPALTPASRFGRFTLQELIKSGGMADIWLVTDESRQHHALRVMHDRLSGDRRARRRFIRGCEVLARVQDHQFIVGYREHGKIQGRLYLLMEYVEGANLKELYARHDPVLVENVAQLLIDMALALEHIHACGFMHLDFKPENVLVSPNASVRLVDFDIAQPIPPAPKRMPSNPGTPAYMAPEQLARRPLDQRVDIFAYGVAAYELLTNQKPFNGATPTEILRQQTNRADFLSPRYHNADIPVALERIILRCLEQDPDRRYAHMSVLSHELQAALYL